MSAIGYRIAGPGDAAALAELARRTFIDTFAHLYQADDLAAFLASHDEQSWSEKLGDPAFTIRLAEADGRAIGYCGLGPPSLPVQPQGPAIELRQLYILRPWQGSGVAAELMDWALAEALRRGAAEMYLTVYVDNHRARRFYERYGFRFVAPYAFMVGEQADEDHILRLALRETV